MSTNKKVILGLSGGVDSTAAVLLLQKAGYQVTGLFFSVTENREEEHEKAREAAAALGIPLLYRELSAPFRERIVSYFCGEYMKGRTPNPCVLCNPEIKFRALQEAAEEEGASFIATGHYAGVEQDSSTGIWFPVRGRSQAKDQSYMLYRLPQDILSRLLLPLGEMASKEEVRALAKAEGAPNADAGDSQEICFIPDGDYVSYMEGLGFRPQPGFFLDREGKVLGKHRGLPHYTIGQRKGLGLAFGKPMYVEGLDGEANTVTLGDGEGLLRKAVWAEQCFFHGYPQNTGLPAAYEGLEVLGKIRYAATPAPAVLRGWEGGRLLAEFREAQRAPAPGQSMVFYAGDRVIGGGIICGSEVRGGSVNT
ncbi:MAG: tRNA 2-thiouridine(34) synthase MnmA [Bacillota bacterium]|nr:tRNA 2-thiouridine(34) synthase MnmA [Bacillota bacterium]